MAGNRSCSAAYSTLSVLPEIKQVSWIRGTHQSAATDIAGVVMNDKILLEETTETRDFADFDLDVRIAEGELEAADFGAAGGGWTSPSTYGVQSRCPLCCA
jgi:lantipeptide (TIGR04451 family)